MHYLKTLLNKATSYFNAFKVIKYKILISMNLMALMRYVTNRTHLL